MICRVWHGWTTPANAVAYERLLLNEILPGIKARSIDGFIDADVIRRSMDGEVEFVTLCWFTDMEAVAHFTGGDTRQSVIPERAKKLLARYDDVAVHFQVARKAPGRDKAK